MITTIDTYVAAVGRALGPGAHAAELAELRSQLQELAAAHGEAGACELMGEPSEYAAALQGDVPERDPEADVPRFLGIPFTAGQDPREGLRRMFDPSNPKIIVPKVMGYGWTVNWGAVAVKLHLLRPDDIDDDVFAHMRLHHLALGGIVPVAIAAAAIGVCAWGIRQGGEFPVHWSDKGVRYAAAPAAFGPILALELAFAVAIVAAIAVGLRKRWLFVAIGALAIGTWSTGFMGSFAVMEAVRTQHGWWILIGLLATLLLAGVATLVPLRLALQRTWADSRTGLIREGRR